jgi:hypothetical protein
VVFGDVAVRDPAHGHRREPGHSPDPTWLPLIVGNHPEYPSGHARGTAALTESLRNYFGTKRVELVMSSTAAGAGVPRTYENLDDLVADVQNARVWGGLHFRTTMTRTAKYFPRIARQAVLPRRRQR